MPKLFDIPTVIILIYLRFSIELSIKSRKKQPIIYFSEMAVSHNLISRVLLKKPRNSKYLAKSCTWSHFRKGAQHCPVGTVSRNTLLLHR